MTEEEIQYIQDAQAGDTTAFDQLVRIHDRRILQVAFSMLGNLQDAQDVYQEAFMKAFLKISTFRFESEFSTWLTKIAMNLAINRLRQQKLRSLFSLDEKKEDQSNWDFLQDGTNPTETDHGIQSQEIMQMVKNSLQQLPNQQRAVFILKHLHGCKISEIAQTLNCAEGTVKNQLFRAIRRLRKELKPYYQGAL